MIHKYKIIGVSMKKRSGFIIMIVMAIMLSLGLVACNNSSGKEIKVTISKSEGTENITEFIVREVKDGKKGAPLSLGSNTLTIEDSTTVEVFIKVADDFRPVLTVNGKNVSVSYPSDSETTPNSTFIVRADSIIDLSAKRFRHKVTVNINDNTNGLSGFNVKYKDELKTGSFEIFTNETFEYTKLSTEANADYRFITTIDCVQYGGIKDNSEGLSANPWAFVALNENDKDVITIKIDVEFLIDINVTEVPLTLRANLQVKAIDFKDVPTDVTAPNDIIKYGVVVARDKPNGQIWVYIQKDMMFAIVCDDGNGNLSFFPHEIVDDGLQQNAGIHIVTKQTNIKIMGV